MDFLVKREVTIGGACFIFFSLVILTLIMLAVATYLVIYLECGFLLGVFISWLVFVLPVSFIPGIVDRFFMKEVKDD